MISVMKRFWSHVNKTNACWLWTASTAGAGYGVFYNGEKCVRAPKFIYEKTRGPVPRGMEVCHSCDTPRCVRPSHLFAATHRVNIQDSVRKGRRATMEKHGNAKLTQEAVIDIRTSNHTSMSLARKYGVSHKAIRLARKGETWRGVNA